MSVSFWSSFAGLFATKPSSMTPIQTAFGLEARAAWDAKTALYQYAQDGYLRSIVDKIGNGVAATRWRVFKPVTSNGTKSRAAVRDYAFTTVGWGNRNKSINAGRADSSLIEVPNHPLLSILADPSPELTGFQWWLLLTVYLELAGEVFLLVLRNGKQVVGFQPIPPHAVVNTPSDADPNFTIGYESLQGRYTKDQVIWIKHPNPLQPLRRGTGLGQGVQRELEAVDAIARSIRGSMKRNGHPTLLVGVDQGQTPGAPGEAVDALKETWQQNHGSAGDAGKVLFANGKLTATPLNLPFREMQTLELSDAMLDRVRMVFGVSAEVLGDLSSGDQSKAEAAQYALAATVIAPRVEFLRSAFQKWLVPLVDVSAVLHYDDPRPQERERAMEAMTNPTTAPAYQMNEVRELNGFAALPELDGKFLLPMPGTFAPSQGQDGQPDPGGSSGTGSDSAE